MRMTREKDEWECRMKECTAEDWIFDLIGEYAKGSICDSCPFEPYINKLAEFEDEEEVNEDDLK